jgi:chromosome segregation ATPase
VAALGTPTERAQWATVARLEEQISTLPPGLERDETRDKLRLIKGVLYWRLDANFKARAYQEQHSLREIDAALEELQNRWVRVQQARSTVPSDTDEFAARIAALAARVHAMRERLSQTSQQQSHYLDDVAESELQAQKERLDAYALQARFALADIYDRGADQGGSDAAAPAAPVPPAAPAPAPNPESK